MLDDLFSWLEQLHAGTLPGVCRQDDATHLLNRASRDGKIYRTQNMRKLGSPYPPQIAGLAAQGVIWELTWVAPAGGGAFIERVDVKVQPNCLWEGRLVSLPSYEILEESSGVRKVKSKGAGHSMHIQDIMVPEVRAEVDALIDSVDMVFGGTGSHTIDPPEVAVGKAAEIVGDEAQWHHDNILGVFGAAQRWDELMASIFYVQNLPYILILPTPDYGEYYWSGQDKRNPDKTDRRAAFAAMCDAAVGVYYVAATPAGNKGGKFGAANNERNDVMVELWAQAERSVVFVFDSGSAGTAQCFDQVRKAGLDWYAWDTAGVQTEQLTVVERIGKTPKKPARKAAAPPRAVKAVGPAVTATPRVTAPVATITAAYQHNRYGATCPVCLQLCPTNKGYTKKVAGTNVTWHRAISGEHPGCEEPYTNL